MPQIINASFFAYAAVLGVLIFCLVIEYRRGNNEIKKLKNDSCLPPNHQWEQVSEDFIKTLNEN